ncbi:MAG: killer suppression protein [Nitrospirae bacterium]|nr:killer suppression protein [Nitrospirota bacterium]
MEIFFRKEKTAKTMNSHAEMVKVFGERNAVFIERRMQVLRAASSLAEVPHTPPERRHELTGKMKGFFAVDAKHPKRIVFTPYHNPIPKKDDGGIDLERITSIEIVDVEDYH